METRKDSLRKPIWNFEGTNFWRCGVGRGGLRRERAFKAEGTEHGEELR